MNNISLINYKKCFSCRSCFLSCPKNAIEMIENQEGFFYPKVIEDKCIDCGLCVKKCPSLNDVKKEDFEQYGLAVISKDKETLLKSSSGAASAVIAKKIVSDGGVVFGVAYDENLFVHHISCKNESELEKIKGSKYVESFTGETFKEVESYLKNGQKVLYTGSPCQIAGLKKFLGKDYENLFTMDLICHGVPSRKLFAKYLDWLGNKYKGKIIYYGFRDKDVGGWSCGGKVKTKTKTKTLEAYLDLYYSAFLKSKSYRESCYSCPYARIQRIGDLTVGDFWGVEKFYPEIDKKNGVSCVLVNSEKGKALFEFVKESFEITPCKLEEVQKQNWNLNQPSKRPEVRDSFYKDIDEDCYFSQFVETKISFIIKWKIKHFVFSVTPRWLKDYIKKILGK